MSKAEILSSDHPQILDRAISTLREGGVVAIPTDTVYGIAADAWSGEAVSKLYEVKNRSELKPIPVLLRGEEAVGEVAEDSSGRIRALAAKFWPGPLTIVVNRNSELPSEVGNSTTVGIRAPDHKFALALLKSFGPLATTSANPSGLPTSTTADQVIATLGGTIDLIIDDGETGGGIPSTVISIAVEPPSLLRQGPISIESVLRVWESY